LFAVACVVSAWCGVAWAEGAQAAEFSVGKATVWAIADSTGDREAGVFPDADPEALAQYMPTGRVPSAVMVFLVKTGDETILIDTGMGAPSGERASRLDEGLKQIGVAPEEITVVLITHMHGDHIGSLQKDGRPVFTNAKVYVNVREREHFTKTAVNAAAVAALNAYGANVVAFDTLGLGPVYREILPGVRAITAYGHTPGHTAYMVTSGSSKLIIAGDFLHVGLVQFPNPGISASFDMDPRAAADTRWQFLSFAAMTGIPIGGMHIGYPCIGKVEASGNGFRFVPVR